MAGRQLRNKLAKMLASSKQIPPESFVEYIQSTGTSGFYIDTGITKPSGNFELYYAVGTQFVSIPDGGYQEQGSKDYVVFGVENMGGSSSQWVYADDKHVNGADTQPHGIVLYLKVSGNSLMRTATTTLYVDDNQVGISGRQYNLTFWRNSLGIFNKKSGESNGWYAKIYSVIIMIDSTTVRNFRPYRVGQTGYLYDTVSGQLFSNEDSGTFILGPDVDPPVGLGQTSNSVNNKNEQ